MAISEIHDANGNYAGYAVIDANGNLVDMRSTRVRNAIRTVGARQAARATRAYGPLAAARRATRRRA